MLGTQQSATTESEKSIQTVVNADARSTLRSCWLLRALRGTEKTVPIGHVVGPSAHWSPALASPVPVAIDHCAWGGKEAGGDA